MKKIVQKTKNIKCVDGKVKKSDLPGASSSKCDVISADNAMSGGQFDRIVDIVKSGGIVIFPTDTVYGIGASIKFKGSIEKIYRLKKRPAKKEIGLLISSWRESSHLVGRVSQRVRMLMKEYWPGPVTFVLASRAGTMALRVPNHKFALKLLSAVGPMAVTSANMSGKKPAGTFSAIDPELLKGADIVVKENKPLSGIPSSILDLTGGEIEIIRERE
ncbi:threonylcarbamoyl-AMP synthase [bacterium]|nr:threonylcarbamoyl-AMP synthase [bacterium]MBU4134195.1 threonylcarbamoyl-AMP synthase [bacterium]